MTTSLTSKGGFGPRLQDLMTKEQRPGHLMRLAYQFLDKLPGALGAAVADAAAAERGLEGRPHRATEARRILPIRTSAAAHYCKSLPDEVGLGGLLVEVLNYVYLGGKKVLGNEILNDPQRTALEGLPGGRAESTGHQTFTR